MIIDERFAIRPKQLECSAFASMNLAPPGDDTRVGLLFRPVDNEDNRSLEVRLSRAEALKLGQALVRYGEMKIPSEWEKIPHAFSGHTYTMNCKLCDQDRNSFIHDKVECNICNRPDCDNPNGKH